MRKRVNARTWTKDKTTSTLPRFTRTRISTRLPDETSVTSCGRKDATSAMVKLATKIEESTCGVIDYGVASRPVTHCRTNCGEQCRRSSSRQADCQVQVKTRAFFEEKADCVMRSMRLTPKQDVDGELRVNEATHGNHFEIHEVWSGWHRRACSRWKDFCRVVALMKKLIEDSARDSSGGVMWAATSLWRLGPRGGVRCTLSRMLELVCTCNRP